MIRIFSIQDGFDATGELRGILGELPEWRLRKALSFRQEIDRFLCAKSFLLLEGMLREQFGIERCPEFSYGNHGKPYLRDYPGISFNISHCRRGIACAVLDRPVGIDIEEIQFDKGLADLVLSPEELYEVERSVRPDLKFTELWTLKESFLKLSGEGLSDNMKEVLHSAGGVDFKTEINDAAGYVCSTAVAGHAG